MALLWYPINFESHTLRVVYATIAYLLYATVSTIIGVPYSSHSTEITGDFSLRNRANLLRLAFSLLSTAICTLAPTILFSRLTNQKIDIWQFYFIIIFGSSYYSIPNICAGIFCKERVPYADEKSVFLSKCFCSHLGLEALESS